MSVDIQNPVLSGFNPDPSIVRVGEDYYLATSTFEYLPGIPIYHSKNLQDWNLVGHVATRSGQLAVENVPTGGGAWAPTLRYHDGKFWVVITDAMGRGTIIFTAERPEGPWTDGLLLEELNGIDPDIIWDEQGTCYMTYSALRLTGESLGAHDGIEQVRIDPYLGKVLEEPRSLWSGTGLMFPEAPHLYQIDGWWYLLIAEGGTERGHGVSIARSKSPMGPFESGPNNPFLSARSTARPVQNTGHGDLVQTPDGDWVLFLLGMRTYGGTRAFAPRGRETFMTNVRWVDGWPQADPVHLTGDRSGAFRDDFESPDFLPQWLGLRDLPANVGTIANGVLSIAGNEQDLGESNCKFVGIRLMHLETSFSATVDASQGVGGLGIRFDEKHHYSVEVAEGRVTARANVATISQEWSHEFSGGAVTAWIKTEPVVAGFDAMTSDNVILGFDGPDGPVELAKLDGRFLSAESTCSFTGRVVGLYAKTGQVDFTAVRYEGSKF